MARPASVAPAPPPPTEAAVQSPAPHTAHPQASIMSSSSNGALNDGARGKGDHAARGGEGVEEAHEELGLPERFDFPGFDAPPVAPRETGQTQQAQRQQQQQQQQLQGLAPRAPQRHGHHAPQHSVQPQQVHPLPQQQQQQTQLPPLQPQQEQVPRQAPPEHVLEASQVIEPRLPWTKRAGLGAQPAAGGAAASQQADAVDVRLEVRPSASPPAPVDAGVGKGTGAAGMPAWDAKQPTAPVPRRSPSGPGPASDSTPNLEPASHLEATSSSAVGGSSGSSDVGGASGSGAAKGGSGAASGSGGGNALVEGGTDTALLEEYEAFKRVSLGWRQEGTGFASMEAARLDGTCSLLAGPCLLLAGLCLLLAGLCLSHALLARAPCSRRLSSEGKPWQELGFVLYCCSCSCRTEPHIAQGAAACRCCAKCRCS